jgi:hypothetical protein
MWREGEGKPHRPTVSRNFGHIFRNLRGRMFPARMAASEMAAFPADS